MPWTCRTRARVRPPRPAPTIVTGAVITCSSLPVIACPEMRLTRPWWRETAGTLFHRHILEQRSRYVKMVVMAARMQRTGRRTDALSKERIVEATIGILDTAGESGL